MNQDFKFLTDRAQSRASGLHWFALAGVLAVGAVLVSLTPHEAGATRTSSLVLPIPRSETSLEADGELTYALTLPASQTDTDTLDSSVLSSEPDDRQQSPPTPTAVNWQSVIVRQGDNLSAIFSRLGLTAQDVHAVVTSGEAAKMLTRLKPGQSLNLAITPDGALRGVYYEIAATKALQVTAQDSTFTAELIERQAEPRPTYTSGVIESSLFEAGQKAGLPDKLIMELAGIFGWDIDFALDIREGDHFTVVYEEIYLDDRKLSDGAILAAEFVNQNKTYRAVRYTDPQGESNYYAPDGKSMRKAFLRTPVDFTRISSGFSLGRKHPILNRIRAHKGVDYAAPRGTPVKATGDGKIILRGKKGGYGKTVIIQHGSRYSTLYAHLSGFAGGLRNGSRVRQGQVIGYVGSTGLATGPHLHYEFRIDGVHRNPLTVKYPEAEPIPAQYRDDFQAKTTPLLAQLNILHRTTLALNGERP